MRTISLLAIISFIFISCKSQEQIRREQLVDTMSVQLGQNQKLSADFSVRLETLEEQLSAFQGSLETSDHQKTQKFQSYGERIQALEELVETLNMNINEKDKTLQSIDERLKKQDSFIKEILSELKNAGGSKKSSAKSKSLSPYQEAMDNYKRGRYNEARPQLEELLKGKLSKKGEARVIHNLGMIAYMQKRNDDALTYFSKLFTEQPNSLYNANGLIHLAKTFNRMGQKDQAKETLKEMLKKFPKHHRVKIAKDLLSKL